MEVLCKAFQIDVRYIDNACTVWCVISELYVLAQQNCVTVAVCGDD